MNLTTATKVRTRKAANGTYEWTYTGAGEWFPTQAVTAHGARYQGQRFVKGMAAFTTNSVAGYSASDVTLEG